MASDAELFNYFMTLAPQSVLATQGRPEFGDLFNRWAGEVAKSFGVSNWEDIPADQLGDIEWNDAFTLGGSTTGPAEQAIFNQIAPGLTRQIQGDVAREAEAGVLADQTRTAYGNLENVLGQTALRFDAQAYLRENADVAAAFASNPEGLTAEQYAKRHFDTYGKAEGRRDPTTSTLLDLQRGNVDTTVNSVIDASRGNADTARAALATMTGEQIVNLDKSITEQKAALEQQVRELQGSAGEAAAARRAALEQQLAQLTAAQKPVSEARVRAAEAEVTGINLGLESTKDQIAADAAREGFYGPSTMTDSALGRASIDAYQSAARTRGAADVMNATDTRGIGTYGANQGYSITDVFAGDTQRTSDFGAGGRAALTAAGAEGTRGINDQGAVGRFNIATQLGREEAAARTTGAGQRAAYFDSLYPNAVNSAQVAAGLPAARAGALTALLPYSTAGTNNALNTLSWWGGQPVTPPGTTAVTTTPSNAGNQFGQLGSGLVGAGFQIAGANNNWWRPATTTVPPATTTVPPATTTNPANRSTATSPNSPWNTNGGSNNPWN